MLLEKSIILIILLTCFFLLSPIIVDVYGHGLGAETFPPVDIEWKTSNIRSIIVN